MLKICDMIKLLKYLFDIHVQNLLCSDLRCGLTEFYFFSFSFCLTSYSAQFSNDEITEKCFEEPDIDSSV